MARHPSTGTATATKVPLPTTIPTGKQPAQIDARTIIDTYLKQIGLDSLPKDWVWNEITKSGMTDATAIASKVELDLQKTDAFKDRFAGMALREKNGLPPISVSEYLGYEDQARQMAQATGLPTHFMNEKMIADLIGHDVSSSELSSRLTDGLVAAQQAPAETRNLLHQYYGINTGHLAAYYLDPEHALPILQRQLASAQIGSAGVMAGFGDIGKGMANQLAEAGITQSQAMSGFATISPLANALESSLPGQHGEANATGRQLVEAQFLGNANAQIAVQRATEARTAGSRGGGGFASNQGGGVVGAGYGASD